MEEFAPFLERYAFLYTDDQEPGDVSAEGPAVPSPGAAQDAPT